MLTIYGSPQSSSGRCFWCLEEVGKEYTAKSIDFRQKEHKSEEFLAINPNGKVPALTDGDFLIWESMAINFYLAEAYKPDLLGNTAQQHGLIHQWSYWALVELQAPIIEIFIQLVFVPEDRRNQAAIEKAQAKLPNLLTTLDNNLEGKKYILGNEFTLGDLNVSSVVTVCHAVKFDLSEYKNISSWLGLISERPAYLKYQELCS